MEWAQHKRISLKPGKIQIILIETPLLNLGSARVGQSLGLPGHIIRPHQPNPQHHEFLQLSVLNLDEKSQNVGHLDSQAYLRCRRPAFERICESGDC